MEYITTKEAAAKWNISTTRITILANEGRIPGAQRLGKSWLIPATATKPVTKNASHSKSDEPTKDDFSFPMYYFRPDWNSIKESQLSTQQKSLLMAEKAVLECRFKDAYSILSPIIDAPEDIITEAGALWNAAISSMALNMPSEFSKYFLRLEMIMSEDFPHRKDLYIILDSLKTYVDTISLAASSDTDYSEIHDQCLPFACIKFAYTQLTKETMNKGSVDTAALELSLRFLKNSGSLVILEMLHSYLLGIYYLRQNIPAAEKHAKALVQIAYENKYYYPMVLYYRYYTQILDPVLATYPQDFQDHCRNMFSEYEKNFTTFFSSISEYEVISKLTDADLPLIYAILMDLPNPVIAEKLGISSQTVKRKLTKIYEKLGVTSKKELRDYLHNYM